MGSKKIVRRLNEAGVDPPSPKHHSRVYNGWRYVTIRDLLSHPRYIGQAVYGANKLSTRCPPLVDEATYNAANAAIASRANTNFGATKYVYPLQKLVHCRVCGSRYHAYTERRNDLKPLPCEVQGELPRYACWRRANEGPERGDHEGSRWRWRAVELERPVQRWVLLMLTQPEVLYAEIERLRKGRVEEAKEHEGEVKRLDKEIKSLEAQEKRVLEGWRLGAYRTQEQFKSEVGEVRRELSKAEAERAKLKVPAASLTLWDDFTVKLNEDFPRIPRSLEATGPTSGRRQLG